MGKVIGLSGGDALARKLAEISKRVTRKATLRVGYLEGATYPDGTPVAMVAAIHEYGAPRAGIPPRPTMRTMIAAKSDGWGDALGNLLVANNYDAERALDIVGEGIEGQLREQIIATDTPPLSPVTLMLRKMKSEDQTLVVTGATVGEAARRVAEGESTAGVNTKVLDETGHMLHSIDHDVQTGDV